MTRDEVIAVLRAHRVDLEAFGVQSLALFGSLARGEATVTSDVDLLVEFRPEARVGMFKFLDLKDYLENLLGCEVDLVTRAALKPQLRERILREAIDVAA